MKALWIVSLTALLAAAKASSSSSVWTPTPITMKSSYTDLPIAIETREETAFKYAADITTIGSIIRTIELSSPSLSHVESAIASYEYSSPSVVSYFESDAEYSSLVTYTDPTAFKILTDVISVLTAVSGDSAVSYAVSALSSDLYALPSSIDSYVLSIISSPSTVAPSEVSYLYNCYPSVLTYAESVASFTKSHTSIESALSAYLRAAYSVSSIGSAVYSYSSESMYPSIYLTISSLAPSDWKKHRRSSTGAHSAFLFSNFEKFDTKVSNNDVSSPKTTFYVTPSFASNLESRLGSIKKGKTPVAERPPTPIKRLVPSVVTVE